MERLDGQRLFQKALFNQNASFSFEISTKWLGAVTTQWWALHDQAFIPRVIGWAYCSWIYQKWVPSVNKMLQATWGSHFCWLLQAAPRVVNRWHLLRLIQPLKSRHIGVGTYQSRLLIWEWPLEQSIGCKWGLSRRNVVGYRAVCARASAAKTIHTFKPSFCDTHSHYSIPRSLDRTSWACEKCRDNEVGRLVFNCRLLVDDGNSPCCVWRLLLPWRTWKRTRYHDNNNQSGRNNTI
jgi:hypothetical protein